MDRAFLSVGLRPFFLAAGAWACLAMGLWLGVLSGLPQPPTHFAPSVWHAHEMIFGYAAAAIAGFVLTAVPNWTGRPPRRGPVLAGLFVLWLAGRGAVAFSAVIGPFPAALIDCAFLAVLAGLLAADILRAGNRRNLVIVLALLLLFSANLAVHLGEGLSGGGTSGGQGAFGLRLGLAVIVLLITVVGGRITPAFTGNWLKRKGETAPPAPAGRIDGLALAAGALALAAWSVLPGHAASALLLVLAGILHGLRLARWRGLATLSEPLVWILHLGYAWVALGLLGLGLAHWLPVPGPGAALHVLAAGAVGTMTMAVMTRATLGHTGRALAAGPGTLRAYLLVIAAAAARVGAGFAGGLEGAMTMAAGGLWVAGFGLFVILYGPMHLGPAAAGEDAAHG
jgi:uncharacterized protein involved in response to NO